MKALFFGSIGTICDTSEIQRLAYNDSFKDAGLDWHWSVSFYRELLSITGGQNRLKHFIGLEQRKGLSASLLENVHRNKTTIFNERLMSGQAILRPGVARLIDDAKHAGLRLGFISTTERRNIDAIAAALGTAFTLGDFDLVTDRTMIEHEKPAPDVYHVALKSISCKPHLAVAIEDTADCLRSVIGADIACVATPNSFSTEQDFVAAHALVSHLGDPNTPADQLAGRDIVQHGIVTLDTLARLTQLD